jgi:DNA segregation ATPase FtsK/SpoIIIE-like protein
MSIKTVRILLLEDDIKAVMALMQNLYVLEEEMLEHSIDFSLVVLSEYSMVESYINTDSKHEYDVVLLDRDCKVGGSFHALDFSKFDLDKIISISSIPKWNEEAEERGVTRVVWKDNENIFWFAEKVMDEIRIILGFPPAEDVVVKDEPLFDEAVQIVRESRSASASLLQRKLEIGYARAARMLDFLEDEGIIGPAEGNKPREVLI